MTDQALCRQHSNPQPRRRARRAGLHRATAADEVAFALRADARDARRHRPNAGRGRLQQVAHPRATVYITDMAASRR